MLTNIQLIKLCDKLNLPLITCCMKDELPSKIQDRNYIINLQSSTQGDGTHWICLVVQGKNILFYDAFGATPPNEIVNFVKKRKNSHLGFNNWIIQNIKSSNCGWFCLGLLYWTWIHRDRNLFETANEYCNFFSGRTNQNDGILRDFFNNL